MGGRRAPRYAGMKPAARPISTAINNASAAWAMGTEPEAILAVWGRAARMRSAPHPPANPRTPPTSPSSADSIKISFMIRRRFQPSARKMPISLVRSNTAMAMVLAIPRAPMNSAIRDVPQAVERASTTSWLFLARSLAGMAFSPGRAASIPARASWMQSWVDLPAGQGRRRT